jgi:hypothetical protein
LQDDFDAAVCFVAEKLVSVRGVLERQVVGGELADAERVGFVAEEPSPGSGRPASASASSPTSQPWGAG